MSERAGQATVETMEQTAGQTPRGAGVALVGYAPITRVDAERREIELCATSEALDAHGTIFDYAASKAAFTRWLGNVREMHARRAVGRRVGVRCDDEARRIFVRLRISRGAQDTWEKVLDGTLRGASIGASDVVWQRERRAIAGRSRWVQVATRYDLAELSLVDNPSNPDALGVVFVRDATPDVTLLDPLDGVAEMEGIEGMEVVEAVDMAAAREETPPTPDATEEQARRTAPAQQPLHDAARMLLAGCGCPRCEVALAVLADATADADETDADDAPTGVVRRADGTRAGALTDAMTQALAAGLRVNAARLAQFDSTLRATVTALQQHTEQRQAEQATRADDAQRALMAEREEGQAARVVEELRARLARLEAQPAAGGPAAHALARPVEKTLGVVGADMGSLGAASAGDEFRALEALAGRLRDPQAQLAVAAEMIRLQQRADGE